MLIGSVNPLERVLIIAEIGNNHEGDLHLAKQMISAAARAGADAVKFQTIVPERLVSITHRERIAQLKRFQLKPYDFEALAGAAQREGVLFLSTPFDLDSVDILSPLVPVFKISSGDNTFYPLITKIARTGKPILLSTGMMSLADVTETRDRIRHEWVSLGTDPGLALLHCVTSYPTPASEVNLLAIRQLQELQEIVGYSDHSLGIETAVLSVAAGARIVEKHFTVDKNYSSFRDHALSADPDEFSEMVTRIRAAEVLLGTREKTVTQSERENCSAVRRSIVAREDLRGGTTLCSADLGWVRPGGGLKPGEESKIIGKALKRNISRGEKILPCDIADE